jgi:hypothetical protein
VQRRREITIVFIPIVAAREQRLGKSSERAKDAVQRCKERRKSVLREREERLPRLAIKLPH